MPWLPAPGSNSYDVTPQFGTSPRRSIVEDLLLVEALEQVAQAVDDDLVGDDQHALAPVLARQHVDHAAQAQDHVAPALAAGRPEIELADVRALLGELRVLGADAERRQPVEDAELLLAQPLVADAGRRRVGRTAWPACSATRTRRRSGARARRATAARRSGSSSRGMAANQAPSASAWRSPSVGQRHVDVAMGDVDRRQAAELGGVARDVAGALAVPDDPQRLRPLLFQGDPFASCRGPRGGPGGWLMRPLQQRPCPDRRGRRPVYAGRVAAGPTRPSHPFQDRHHERPLLPRRTHRSRHRRLARHRPHDRRRLSRAGARAVYISSRKADACDATARELSSLGDCVSLPADVSDAQGMQSLVAAYGAARVVARHPRQQRRRRLGRRLRHLSREGLGQGRQPQPEDAVLPHPGARRAAAQGGERREAGQGDQHRLDRRHFDQSAGDLFVRRQQGRADPADPAHGAAPGPGPHRRQRDRARARSRRK